MSLHIKETHRIQKKSNPRKKTEKKVRRLPFLARKSVSKAIVIYFTIFSSRVYFFFIRPLVPLSFDLGVSFSPSFFSSPILSLFILLLVLSFIYFSLSNFHSSLSFFLFFFWFSLSFLLSFSLFIHSCISLFPPFSTAFFLFFLHLFRSLF